MVVLKTTSQAGWANVYGPFPDCGKAQDFAENVLHATHYKLRTDIYDLISPELARKPRPACGYDLTAN